MSMEEGLTDGDGEGILKMRIEQETDEHSRGPVV